MEELPTLLEEEDDDNDESNAKQSTSGDDGKTTLPPRKRGRPRREIKEEHEETDEGKPSVLGSRYWYIPRASLSLQCTDNKVCTVVPCETEKF